MQEIIDKNILDSKIVGRFEPRIYAFSLILFLTILK